MGVCVFTVTLYKLFCDWLFSLQVYREVSVTKSLLFRFIWWNGISLG